MRDIGRMAEACRFLAPDAIRNADDRRQGVPLGMAGSAATLYANRLKADPLRPDRDGVALSNGHGSMPLCTPLHLSGDEAVALDALTSVRTPGSICAGHPEIEQRAGVEITAVPLGPEIACAVGMGAAEARFGTDQADHRARVFLGYGCLQEGMGQEAASLAGRLQLGKLTLLRDDDRITDDGDAALSIAEDAPPRFRAAHRHVQEVDGHDVDAAIEAAKADPRTSMIACRTVIARGILRLEGKRGGHSDPLIASGSAKAREARGWPHPAFRVPPQVCADRREAMTRGAEACAARTARLAARSRAAEFARRHSGAFCEGYAAAQKTIAAEAPAAGDRPAIAFSGAICDALAAALPEIRVLCADLEAPTNRKRSRAAFTAADRAGACIHCGVREHLMGAMTDGIAAHGGPRPVSVAHLAFADDERAAMRMAALIEPPGIFVFSHASICVGSNGPTRQPVETLASFRAMPNMHVFRPADAVETAEAWAPTPARRDGPSMFALSKQPAMQVRREALENRSARIARMPAGGDAPRDATLIATGTEVGLAMQARATLAAQGIRAAVVSMPCRELFAAQTSAWQAETLGEAPRIAVEAALKFGGERRLRPKDRVVDMTGFGESAGAETFCPRFGIAVAAIVAAAQDLVGAPA